MSFPLRNPGFVNSMNDKHDGDEVGVFFFLNGLSLGVTYIDEW